MHHWVGQFFVLNYFFPFVLSLFVIRGGYIYIHLFQVIPTTRKYGPNNSFNISLILYMIFMNIQSNEVVMENLNKQVNNYLTTRVFVFQFSHVTPNVAISHMRIWLNMATKKF